MCCGYLRDGGVLVLGGVGWNLLDKFPGGISVAAILFGDELVV
jgi:hypothetical protein